MRSSVRVGLTLVLALGLAPRGSGQGDLDEPERLAEAAAHVRAGRTDEALNELASLATARVGYLRGRLLARSGRHAEAAEAFGAVTGDDLPEPIRADLAERHALALVRAGDCAAAEPKLEAVDSALGRALAAQCALQLGRHEDAIRLLRAAAEEDGRDVDTFAVRLQLAEAHFAAGQERQGRRTLEVLFVRHAAHPDVSLALEGLMAHGGPPELSEEEKLIRAEALLDAWRPEEAAAQLEGRPPFNRARKGRWLHLRGMALYKTRTHYAEAAEVLRQAARVGGPTAVADEFHAARALGRADQDLQAIRAYRRLVRRHSRTRWAAQAEYLAAWLELRLGRFGGERRMEAFLEGPRANVIPSLRRDATWQLGITAFEAGQHARAARLLSQYARLGSGPMEEGRGRYWQGRALEAKGDVEDAKDAYRRARAEDPLHYYGVLAARRLAALGVEEPIPLNDPPPEADAMQIQLADAVCFYRTLGLDSDATAAVRRSESSLRRQAPSGRVNETLIRAHGQAHSYTRAYRLSIHERERLRMKPEGDALWAWQAAYPRPAFDTVVRESRRWGMPWSLVYAVMRQESAYDPDVVSGAGAIGLLQVMPEVGGDRGGASFSLDQLFVPEDNVRIGVAELASAVNRFDHQVPLAIAAYNAGVARVERWRRETGPIDFDLWVEKIPFDETRNYVRRVLSHFAHYRYVATGEAELPLPDQVTPERGNSGDGTE